MIYFLMSVTIILLARQVLIEKRDSIREFENTLEALKRAEKWASKAVNRAIAINKAFLDSEDASILTVIFWAVAILNSSQLNVEDFEVWFDEAYALHLEETENE